jgi:hypothetical protein
MDIAVVLPEKIIDHHLVRKGNEVVTQVLIWITRSCRYLEGLSCSEVKVPYCCGLGTCRIFRGGHCHQFRRIGSNKKLKEEKLWAQWLEA